ncbi:MAG: hypothetical protein WD009_09475 [Phycisphaeraceae bacterium]
MMTMPRPRVATSLALALLLTSFAAPARAAELRPAWIPGQAARYEIWALRQRQQEMSFGGDSQRFDMSMETTGEVTWEVESVSGDGSVQATMTFDWLRAEVTGPDGERIVLDSREGGADSQPLRAIAGTPLDVAVDADGSIASVRGAEAMRRQVDAATLVPSDVDLVYNASHLAAVSGSPAEAREGDRWSAALMTDHELGAMHYDMSYRLAEVGEIAGIGVATINAEGRMDLEVDLSDMPEGAPPMDVRLRDATSRSQIIVDLSRHEVVGRNNMESSRIEIVIDLGGQRMTQTMSEQNHSQVLRIWEQ